MPRTLGGDLAEPFAALDIDALHAENKLFIGKVGVAQLAHQPVQRLRGHRDADHVRIGKRVNIADQLHALGERYRPV